MRLKAPYKQGAPHVLCSLTPRAVQTANSTAQGNTEDPVESESSRGYKNLHSQRGQIVCMPQKPCKEIRMNTYVKRVRSTPILQEYEKECFKIHIGRLKVFTVTQDSVENVPKP